MEKTDEGVCICHRKTEKGPIPARGIKEGSLEEAILWQQVDGKGEGVPGREACWRYEGTGYLQVSVFAGGEAERASEPGPNRP